MPVIYEIHRLSSSSSAKKEQICVICESSNNSEASNGLLVQCKGSCLNNFHTVCANISDTENFKCTECSTGKPHSHQ